MPEDGEEATFAVAACEREIRSLHTFFVRWYTGDDRADFDRFENALAPSFEMVTPDGEVLGRDEVLAHIRGERGEHENDGFGIEISNVETLDKHAGRALVRYEEWQETKDGEDGRVSTALFRPSGGAPEGVEWIHLHETGLGKRG